MRFADENGYYELNPFPGCNQLVVSNHAFIWKDKRGQGLGKKQHEARLAKARELGYNAIICTVRVTNTVEKAILTKYGWTKVHEFLNTESDVTIEIWLKTLREL